MTMVNRTAPDAAADLVFTEAELELRLLDALVNDKADHRDKTLATYLVKLARLGGYVARATILRPATWSFGEVSPRLTDIELGATMGTELLGN